MALARSFRAEMTGLSERDRTLLRSLLHATQARTGIHWDGDTNHPSVHFVDIDSPQGSHFWDSLGADRSRSATIVIAQHAPHNRDDANWLPKPLRSSGVIYALEKMRTHIAASAPTTPTLPAAPASAPIIQRRLLEFLEQANNATTQLLRSAHWPDLVIAAGGKKIMRTAPIDDYVNGFSVSLDVEMMTKYTGGPLPDEQAISLNSLRWIAMLHAPMNEISHRLPTYEYVRLTGLPDFGLWEHSIAHVRMAAWLMQYSASPLQLSEMVAADDETVRRFLGACAATGLLQEAEAPAAAPAPVVHPPLQAVPSANAPTSITSTRHTTAVTGDALSVLERLRASRAQG
jgi:hypothetical protein